MSPTAIIDGMSLIHKIHGDHGTFGDLSHSVSMVALIFCSQRSRRYVVFDTSREESIKMVNGTPEQKMQGVVDSSIPQQDTQPNNDDHRIEKCTRPERPLIGSFEKNGKMDSTCCYQMHYKFSVLRGFWTFLDLLMLKIIMEYTCIVQEAGLWPQIRKEGLKFFKFSA